MPVVNALQPTYGGGPAVVFIMKLDSTGSQLLFSSYLGGTGDDRGFDARLDGNRELYVSGTTGSPNFPVLNALQPTSGGGQDAFLTKMNWSGSAILYSTYLGGSGTEQFGSLAVDTHQVEPLRYRLDHTIGDSEGAALEKDVEGDVLEIRFRLRCEAIRHQREVSERSAGRDYDSRDDERRANTSRKPRRL